MLSRADVVCILATFGDQRYRGTGFYIELRTPQRCRHALVTAFHVVANDEEGSVVWADSIMIESATVDGHDYILLEEDLDLTSRIGFDPWEDWVAFAVERPALRVWRPAHVHGLRDWTTYGFPFGTDEDGVACFGRITSMGSAFKWSACGIERKVRCVQLQSEEASAGSPLPATGFSGAPVVVEGRAIGLIRSYRGTSGNFDAAGGILLACPIEHMIEELCRCLGLTLTIESIGPMNSPGYANGETPKSSRAEPRQKKLIGDGVLQDLTERARPFTVAILAWEGAKSLLSKWGSAPIISKVFASVSSVSKILMVIAGVTGLSVATVGALQAWSTDRSENIDDNTTRRGTQANNQDLSPTRQHDLDTEDPTAPTEPDDIVVQVSSPDGVSHQKAGSEHLSPPRGSANPALAGGVPDGRSKKGGSQSRGSTKPGSTDASVPEPRRYDDPKLTVVGPEVPFEYFKERAIGEISSPSPSSLRNTRSATEKASGIISVYFCVDENGTVKHATIRTELPNNDQDVNQIILDTVRRWRFEPMPTLKCTEQKFKLTFQ
jgi:outer membrane biosynthesis protein TonB